MSTHNHTAISTGAAANAGTINTPLGALDAAIGSLADLTTTAKTSAVAAINEVKAVAVGVADSGNILKALQKGAHYDAQAGVTWNPTTKVLSLGAPAYIMHGIEDKYVRFPANVTINFSAATSYMYAYIKNVARTGAVQDYATADVVVEHFTTLTENMQDADIFVLAVYSAVSGAIATPFVENRMQTDYLRDAGNDIGKTPVGYECRGGASWNPTTKILTLGAPCYIIHCDGTANRFVRFSADVTVNFSAITGVGFAYIEGVTRGVVQDYVSADIDVVNMTVLTKALTDTDVYIIAIYYPATGTIYSPFLDGYVHLDYLNRAAGDVDEGDLLTNLYPQVLSKLAPFAAKLLAPAADVNVVLWGDSLLVREDYTSVGALDPTALPPLVLTQNIAYYLWDAIKMPKATYRRYDYTAYFTEVGTWATSLDGDNTANGGPATAWDDAGDRSGYTRISDSATAKVTWTLGIADDESGCNFIYRTDTAGDVAARIAVAEGAGYLEYWNGAAWAEANAATFSMLEADEGARRGNSIYGKRLRLRKTSAHDNDSVTIAIQKAAADSDRLLYWGVELYDAKNGEYIPILINSARGGHTINQGADAIYDYMDDDVLDQNPDLVIFSIPLMNMLYEAGATKDIIVNSVWDTIWGDRPGNTNTWNLKTISGDWADFQVLVVIPHHRRTDYETDSTFHEPFAGWTSDEIYNAVKGLLYTKGDVAFVDIAAAFRHRIDADPLWSGDYYAALNSGGATGSGYTADNTHQNDKGTQVWRRHLCPIFDFNTL